MMNFTNDEMNLMCIYQSDSRSGLIAALTEMRGYRGCIRYIDRQGHTAEI